MILVILTVGWIFFIVVYTVWFVRENRKDCLRIAELNAQIAELDRQEREILDKYAKVWIAVAEKERKVRIREAVKNHPPVIVGWYRD